jgi:hypothetical protein
MRLTPPNLRDSNRNNGGLQMIGKSGCRVLREQCRVFRDGRLVPEDKVGAATAE